MTNLLHELEVKGLPRLRIELEHINCTTVSVQQYGSKCKLEVLSLSSASVTVDRNAPEKGNVLLAG